MSGPQPVDALRAALLANPALPAAPPAQSASERPFVAVVVFHGMGQQRHYEMVAEVVEAIDAHVFRQHRLDPARFKAPRLDRVTKREVDRGTAGGEARSGSEHVFVQAEYPVDGKGGRVRFYEGYWAPAAVDGTSARSVLTWLTAQITRPFTLLFSPWRAFGRLRRADLIEMAFGRSPVDPDGLPKEWSMLARLYAAFCLRRPPERGRFRDFIAFLVKALPDNAALRNSTLALAHRWHHRHMLRQWKHAALLLGIGLTALAGVFILAVLVLGGLQGALREIAEMPGNPWIQRATADLKADLPTVLSVLSLLFGALGVTAFLRDSVGDVQQFVTYDQAQSLYVQRDKILVLAEATLRQVLSNPACERVVIVAHSLGTAVALDTILRLRAWNEAHAPYADDDAHMKGPLPLHKIQHFITCGSPIDKINYFFATLRSRFRSFETMFDQLRGDIGNIPFSRSGRQPYIHWVNFWDQGDPISGALHSVASASVLRVQRVDNVRVASMPWPDPAGSHVAYFANRDVVAHVFRTAFRNEASFATPPKVPAAADPAQLRPVYEWQGPGRASRLQSALYLLLPTTAVLVMWTALGIALPSVPAPSLFHTAGVVGLLVMGAVVQRLMKWQRARVDADADP